LYINITHIYNLLLRSREAQTHTKANGSTGFNINIRYVVAIRVSSRWRMFSISCSWHYFKTLSNGDWV